MLGPLKDALANAHCILPSGAAKDVQVAHRNALCRVEYEVEPGQQVEKGLAISVQLACVWANSRIGMPAACNVVIDRCRRVR
jgi:hypothetical protein